MLRHARHRDHGHTYDLKLRRRETERTRRGFERVRRAEQQYARGLRGIARHIGELVRGMAPDSPDDLAALEEQLRGYSDIIGPWAEKHAARMLADVSRRDEAVWAELSKTMSRALRQEIQSAPTGLLLRGLLEENVKLIRSLPTEAAERVHELTLEGLTSAKRPEEIAKEIARSGEVSIGRANTIARTEVARTSSRLVEVRAIHVGSEGYIWRTAGDSDVRASHKKMSGRFVRWDEPPTLDGMTGHAGQLINCRCYPAPVLSDEP